MAGRRCIDNDDRKLLPQRLQQLGEILSPQQFLGIRRDCPGRQDRKVLQRADPNYCLAAGAARKHIGKPGVFAEIEQVMLAWCPEICVN